MQRGINDLTVIVFEKIRHLLLININILVLERQTQSSAHSALAGCIRGAAESRAELLQIKTMFAQGVVDKLVQLMAKQSHK